MGFRLSPSVGRSCLAHWLNGQAGVETFENLSSRGVPVSSSPFRANPRIAMLVDCDNVAPGMLAHALAEIRRLAPDGRVVMRRAYGNTITLLGKWKDVLARLAFMPCLQYQQASGKNTADIALALDALEALLDERADTFCIVTSDSDFVHLCRKLRERGAAVVMVGEEKTPEALRNAADHFVQWKKPANVVPEALGAAGNVSGIQKTGDVMQAKQVSGATSSLRSPSEVRPRSLAAQLKPSVQTPKAKLPAQTEQKNVADSVDTEKSPGIKQHPGFVLDAVRAILTSDEQTEASGVKRQKVLAGGKQGRMVFAVDLSALGQHLRKQYPAFSAKKYGHKTLANLLKGFPSLHVMQEKSGSSRVCLRATQD